MVVSSTGSHKIGFVDTRDIAEAAFHAMTDEVSLNGSYLVFGPELLTYADVSIFLNLSLHEFVILIILFRLLELSPLPLVGRLPIEISLRVSSKSTLNDSSPNRSLKN